MSLPAVLASLPLAFGYVLDVVHILILHHRICWNCK